MSMMVLKPEKFLPHTMMSSAILDMCEDGVAAKQTTS